MKKLYYVYLPKLSKESIFWLWDNIGFSFSAELERRWVRDWHCLCYGRDIEALQNNKEPEPWPKHNIDNWSYRKFKRKGYRFGFRSGEDALAFKLRWS